MTQRVFQAIAVGAVAFLSACTSGDSLDQASEPVTAVCPEGVRISARGNPIGLVSGHIRWCWPGEARCYCDADNDCYAQAGYVPCTQPSTGTDAGASTDAVTDTGVRDGTSTDVAVSTDAGATTDVAVSTDAVVSTDAGPLAADNPSYTGALSTATGSYRGSLTVAGERRDVWVHVPTTRPTRPALVIAFHGTNGDGDVVMTDANLRTVANTNGFVVIAPTARWFGGEGGDYDHPGGNGTYWETRNTDPNTNPDLVLTRAIMVEAQARYNVDPDRIYVLGHSNGGFMSLLVSVALRDRIAAFAENSAGQVTCADRPSCSFQGSALTCAGLATQSGWCGCSGYAFPAAVPTSGRRVPGYLAHGAQDPMVSVFYTCALGANLSAAGGTVEVAIRNGGHDLPASFGATAWSFFSRFRR